jgi:putative tryptophan/tyrosine transport system substrate-binding protein
LLRELLPRAERFAVLIATGDAGAAGFAADVQRAAQTVDRSVDIDAVFARLVQRRTEALVVAPQGLFANRRVQLVTLAARHAIPTIYSVPDYTEIGGMMSYGASARDQHRQAGVYTGRILKGESPADLPVIRAIKFEFIINRQTARTLGIEVPPTLLAIADEVID